MKKSKPRLTSDRIATLGSRMMNLRTDLMADQALWIFSPWSSSYVRVDLTLGDIRDAGASLVAQADGPEPVALKQSRKRKAGR